MARASDSTARYITSSGPRRLQPAFSSFAPTRSSIGSTTRSRASTIGTRSTLAQLSLLKRYPRDQFDFNYTLAKSDDLALP